MTALPGLYNYWIVIVLMMIGFYAVIASGNLVKKLIGLNIFQTSVFLFYITLGKVSGGSAPIIAEGVRSYSNPLPHVLILTAIRGGHRHDVPRVGARGAYTGSLRHNRRTGNLRSG